jgi:hypothetical protein
MALRRGAPPEFYNHAGANSSAENPDPRRNPGLKHTWTDVTFKKFKMKKIIKVKILGVLSMSIQ